jgi:hypothetical protein
MFTVTEKDRIELEALRKLEVAVRQMFEFTGWDDNCDGEPAMCVRKVIDRLDQITETKNLLLCDDR